MRYRALDQYGDMTFGQGQRNFLINTPDAVGQAVDTKLRLWVGDWFLDQTEGTDYPGSVFGYDTQATRESAIRDRILATPGVASIEFLDSAVNDRALTVTATVNTIYGTDPVTILGEYGK